LDKLRAHLGARTGLFESAVEVGEKTYRILHPASAEALIDEEDFARDERLPYWAELWPSAIALARYLSREDLAGRRAIELGCGLGLPTVATLDAGAEVLATDHYEAALDFTLYNTLMNLGREPEAAHLDWHAPDTEHLGTFDLVLAADVLYEARNVSALVSLVPELLAPGGEVVLADPRRGDTPAFLERMENGGFEMTTGGIEVEQGGREVGVLIHSLRHRH
jgi:predicted nicotinamide N-methyase